MSGQHVCIEPASLAPVVAHLHPIARRAADDMYERVMQTVQDYLVENAEYNIGARLASADREARMAREEAARLREANSDLLAACIALDKMWLEDWEPPHPDAAQQEPRILTAECLAIWRAIRAAIDKARTPTVAQGVGR